MKSKEEILVFLLQNSVYYQGKPLTVEEKKERYKENRYNDKYYWYMLDTYIPYMMCELTKLEEFLGEKFSFPKHLKPLADINVINGFNFHYPESIAGLVKNYDTGISYVAFYPGSTNPNYNRATIYPWI